MLEKLPAAIRDAFEPIPRRRLHVTLRFLGDVPNAESRQLEQALAAELSLVDFVMELSAPGVFVNPEQSVLWLGVHCDRFPEVLADIERAMIDFRVAPVDHDFVGHLTIARVRTDSSVVADLETAVSRIPAPARLPVRTRSVVLFESSGAGGFRRVARFGANPEEPDDVEE